MGQWGHHFGSRRCPGLTMLFYRILGSSMLQHYATFLKRWRFPKHAHWQVLHPLRSRQYEKSQRGPAPAVRWTQHKHLLLSFGSWCLKGLCVNKALIFRVHYWEVIEIKKQKNKTESNETIFKYFRSTVPEGDYGTLTPFLSFASRFVISPVLLQWMPK